MGLSTTDMFVFGVGHGVECPDGFEFVEGIEEFLLAKRKSDNTLFFVQQTGGKITKLTRRTVATKEDVAMYPKLSEGKIFYNEREWIDFTSPDPNILSVTHKEDADPSESNAQIVTLFKGDKRYL